MNFLIKILKILVSMIIAVFGLFLLLNSLFAILSEFGYDHFPPFFEISNQATEILKVTDKQRILAVNLLINLILSIAGISFFGKHLGKIIEKVQSFSDGFRVRRVKEIDKEQFEKTGFLPQEPKEHIPEFHAVDLRAGAKTYDYFHKDESSELIDQSEIKRFVITDDKDNNEASGKVTESKNEEDTKELVKIEKENDNSSKHEDSGSDISKLSENYPRENKEFKEKAEDNFVKTLRVATLSGKQKEKSEQTKKD